MDWQKTRFLTYDQFNQIPLKGNFRPPAPIGDREIKYLTGTMKKKAVAAAGPAPESFTADCGLYGDNCGGDEYFVGSKEGGNWEHPLAAGR